MAEEEATVPMEIGLITSTSDKVSSDLQRPTDAATESTGADVNAHQASGASTESADTVSIDLEKPQVLPADEWISEPPVRAQLSQQAQTVLEADTKGIALQQQPSDSPGAAVAAPLPAELFPLTRQGVLSQLGHFSSPSEGPDITILRKLKKESQMFFEHNISPGAPKQKISSVTDTVRSVLQDCHETFPALPPIGPESTVKCVKSVQNQSLAPVKDNITLSNGFLSANSISNRPKLHTDSSTTKSFAQAAAPPVVSASIPTNGSSPECGLLVERLRGTTLDEYARAIESVAGKKTLVFIGQSPEKSEYVLAFLEKPILVDRVVTAGITIRSKWVCVTHICQPASKLIISDVLPFIPDNIILKACSGFGKPVYGNLRRIPSSVRSQEFKHLLSFRRELLIVLDENKPIPSTIKVFSHEKFYTLGITAPGLVCFNCRVHGHRASVCKYPRSTSSNEESYGELPSKDSTPRTPQSQGNTLEHSSSSSAPTERPSIFKQQFFKPVDMRKVNDFKSMQPGPQVASNMQNIKIAASQSNKNSSSDNSRPSLNVMPAVLKTASNECNEAWQLVGKKKGKAFSLSKIPDNPPPKPKAIKYDKLSDVSSTLMYSPPEDDSGSLEGSVTEEMIASTPGVDTKRRRKRAVKQVDDGNQISPKLSENQEPPVVTNPVSSNLKDNNSEPGCILQLKKIMNDLHRSQEKKDKKFSQKEVNLAQPIIEDLLQSIWSLRSAKRRQVLDNFKERHPQLLVYIETIMAMIPITARGTQVFKTLSSIKQEVKSNYVDNSSSSRKSRNQKTQ